VSPLDWQGAVALVLALTFGTCMVAIVLDITIGKDSLNPGGQQILAALLGGILGALSTYLGYTIRRRPVRGDSTEKDDLL
jgi:hypothetical protein